MASTAASAPLHSDHVNYLIWRYLQERGYGHAAVQLSRDWNIDPSGLPFAPDVNPHDLVSIIQDGIMFDDLAANVESRDKKYQFTIEKQRKASLPASDAPQRLNELTHPRKRPKLNPRDASSLSDYARSRNAAAAAPHPDSDGMDIDQNGTSPIANDVDMKLEEPPAIISTLEAGESTGIQQPPLARSIAHLKVPGADIIDVSWSPSDAPELFATGGSVWSSWKWPKLSSSQGEEPAEPQCTHHAPSDGLFSVSASARDLKHRLHASAFADEDGSVILLDLDDDDEPRRVLANYHGTATLLRWDFSDTRLLVVSQKSSSNEVSVWRTADSTCLAFVDTSHVVEDAAWTHDDHFILCGQGFLLLHKLPSQGLDGKALDQGTPAKSISTDTMWAFVKYDPYTRRAACVAPDEGELAILGIDDFSFQTKAVQPGQITAIEWDDSFQGLSQWDQNRMRLLFSSSTDGTVKVWNASSSLECVFSLSMNSGVPAMTLAAQKGYIAAAGDGQIFVWKLRWPDSPDGPPWAEEITVWHAPSQAKEGAEHRIGWPVDEAPFHKVSWQPQHNLLAYSAGNEIHVVQIPGV